MDPTYGGVPPNYPGTFQPVMMVPVNGMMAPGMMNPNVNIYEQSMMMRQKVIQQRNEYVQKQLKENFPVKYVTVHAGLLLFVSAIVFSMQIVLLVKGSPLAVNSSGIWLAAYYLFLVFMIYMLYQKRTQGYLLASTLLHMLGMMVSMGSFACNIAIIMVNSYSSTSSYYSSSWSSWSYNTETTTSATYATFNQYLFANIIIAIFSFAGIPLMITFFIVINCTVGGCTGNNRRTGQMQYGNGMGMGMSSMNSNVMPMNQPYMTNAYY